MTTKSTGPRFSLFDELDRGLNHLMNEVLQHDHTRCEAPALSIYEFDDKYVVECDLPGVTLDEISLQINDGVLEISGERQDARDNTKVAANERTFGPFSRKLQLSKDINVDGVDAELGNGVLKVTVPKADSVLPKSITIRKVSSDS